MRAAACGAHPGVGGRAPETRRGAAFEGESRGDSKTDERGSPECSENRALFPPISWDGGRSRSSERAFACQSKARAEGGTEGPERVRRDPCSSERASDCPVACILACGQQRSL